MNNISKILKSKSKEEILKDLSKLSKEKLNEKLLDEANWSKNKTKFKLLVKAGADINYKYGHYGYTPLIVAAANGNKKIVKYLLKHNADTFIIDYENDTALSIAKKHNLNKIVKLLEKHNSKSE